jgi:hypothetical protein
VAGDAPPGDVGGDVRSADVTDDVIAESRAASCCCDVRLGEAGAAVALAALVAAVVPAVALVVKGFSSSSLLLSPASLQACQQETQHNKSVMLCAAIRLCMHSLL